MFHGEWLSNTVPRGLRMFVSAALGAFGMCFSALIVWMLWKIASRGTMPSIGAFVVICAVAIIAGFCLLVARRLASDETAGDRSVLSPAGWTILSVIFVLIAAAFIFATVTSNSYEPIKGAVFSTALAVGSLFARSRATSRTKRSYGHSQSSRH